MAQAIPVEFSNWLNETLRNLNTDETVFCSYICGLLEGDDTHEEKSETLQGILTEIVQDQTQILKYCAEILAKWEILQPKETESNQLTSEDVNKKLAQLMETQTLETKETKHYTEDEKKIREAILSQYSQMTDDEDEADESATASSGASEAKENGLEKNLNAQTVMQAEKIKREQAKIDSQKKKDKDKEDREKQKVLKEEKKEKRKTQKGERKR